MYSVNTVSTLQVLQRGGAKENGEIKKPIFSDEDAWMVSSFSSVM